MRAWHAIAVALGLGFITLGAGTHYDDPGATPFLGGTLTSNTRFNNDVEARFGTSSNYWWVYDSSNTQYELNATNINGSGTDGIVMVVDDGTDDVRFIGSIGAGITPTTTNALLVPSEDDAATPTLAFGDADTGFYESSDDTLVCSTAGTARFIIDSSGAYGSGTLHGGIGFQNASATVPTLNPRRNNSQDGIGSASANSMSLIAGSTEALRATVGVVYHSVAGAALAAAATTFAVSANVMIVDCDGGGNTIGTITGGASGSMGAEVKLIFVDASCTITDTDAHTAQTVDLAGSATNLVSADDTTLTIQHDGTSWYELGRSPN